jgi:hypothetical protein
VAELNYSISPADRELFTALETLCDGKFPAPISCFRVSNLRRCRNVTGMRSRLCTHIARMASIYWKANIPIFG